MYWCLAACVSVPMCAVAPRKEEGDGSWGTSQLLLSELKVSLRCTGIPYQKEGGREKSALIKINIYSSEAALARHSGTSLSPRIQEAERSIFL